MIMTKKQSPLTLSAKDQPPDGEFDDELNSRSSAADTNSGKQPVLKSPLGKKRKKPPAGGSKQADSTRGQLREDLEERLEQRTGVIKASNRELHREIARNAVIEDAILKERDRFRTIVETIPHGIVEFDSKGTIEFANAEYHRIHGYAEGTLVGKCLWDVLKSILPNAQEIIEKQFREQPSPTTLYNTFRSASGKFIDHKVDWNYRRNAEGNIIGIVAIITDVTQQRRAEEEARQLLNQLAHVSRVFTMSEMVSGLAHELNQPLAAIANFAQACRYRLREASVKDRNILLEAIEQIADQADRAGQIIRRLRDFVRRADSSRSQENINDLVGVVLNLLKIEARAQGIRLETDLAADPPQVAVDRIQIEQVITNLVKNAMEATQDQPAVERSVSVRTAINGEGMLEVSVIDAGKGIEAEELERVFEPFYTTKQSGMGLGLAISRSIVQSHGGRLDADWNASRGMTFRFALPIVTEGEKA